MRFAIAFALQLLYFTSAIMSLPKGFVYLRSVDPTILQYVRYQTDFNFVGHRIKGYDAPEIIITQQAATALKQIQTDLKTKGYSLVVYDAYRPQKAVDHFVNWSQTDDEKMKELFYPTLSKKELFKGYIASRSGHTRGSTVDLTLIKLNEPHSMISVENRHFTDGSEFKYVSDGTVDMGTHFDLLHPASNHGSLLISPEATANRQILLSAMEKGGFLKFANEWWHYSLANEPFPDFYFDFDVSLQYIKHQPKPMAFKTSTANYTVGIANYTLLIALIGLMLVLVC